MSNAESKGSDFCGTGPKLQLFMKINWVWMLLSLNRECLRAWKKRLPITHRCPSGANSVIGLPSVCCRTWCQTTSAWKLYFSRLALTFRVQKKDCRPDSSSFYATAVPQKSEPHQRVPETGPAQQSGSAGLSPRQLLGKRSSCRACVATTWAASVLLRVCAQDFWKGKIQFCGKYKPSMNTSSG